MHVFRDISYHPVTMNQNHGNLIPTYKMEYFYWQVFINFYIDQPTALQMVAILDFRGVTGAMCLENYST